MKTILFNDTFSFTDAVIRGQKTMLRDFNLNYHVGDILALGQSYHDVIHHLFLKGSPHDAFLYRMNLVNRDGQYINEDIASSDGFTNKLYVRADLMPYHVRITDVRSEHLQAISEKDLFAEGVRCQMATDGKSLLYTFGDGQTYPTARAAFAALVDYLYGRGTWRDNPETFVYSFHLISHVS